MLLELSDWMARHFSTLRLFQYITFRTIMAALTAMAMSLLFGPALIRKLAALKAGQVVRKDGPQTHLSKAGTPTMGGVMVLLSVAVTTLLWADLHNRYVWTVLAVMLAYGAIGFYDDYRKLVLKDSRGLASRWKYFWQSVFGVGAALFLYYSAPQAVGSLPVAETALYVPVFKHVVIPMGLFFVVLTYFMIVGFSNAVNLTDGLDGLAIGTSVAPLAAMVVIGSQTVVPAATIGAAAGVGSCVGFLFYNRHPAKMFMGDTGSLALGALLSGVAILSGEMLLLLLIGGVFVAEALSVIVQVAYFKATNGKRILRMSPLHHHFELCDWPETKVTSRFWLASLLCSLAGLAIVR